jgi:hypothetical protein
LRPIADTSSSDTLPKPLHGWREFVGEVGIIVLGVLIALTAEQLAETLQWHVRVAEAESGMRKELSEDDGAQAQARLALSPCFRRELDTLTGALLSERDRGVPFTARHVAVPPFRTWDDNAWRAAVSADATLHMSTARMFGWSSAYEFIPDMNEAALRESSDWADLSRIRQLRAHPSETEREAMLAAIGRARHDNELLTKLSRYFLIFSARAGVNVPASAAADEFNRQRGEMGGC